MNVREAQRHHSTSHLSLTMKQSHGWGSIAVCTLLVGICPSAAQQTWNHGWETSAAMTFADFNNNHAFTDSDIAFASQKYRIISLEKCTGIGSGLKTEEAIYATAAKLKAANPTQKVIFYLATDQQGASCYAFNTEFLAHPEWHLKDDSGNFIMRTNSRQLDPTVPAARDWWTSIPLKGDDGKGNFNGQPVAELIDGVLADSGGYEVYANVSVARLQALADAKQQMLAQLQQKMSALNGGIVMANGISMYGGVNADPRFPGDHNVNNALSHVNAIMNEHTAVFECVNRNNASFNVDTTERDLEAIERAAAFANGSKTVFVQTWPGMMSTTGFTDGTVYPPVASGGDPSPRNNADWVVALRKNFAFAHALFLSIAQTNTYWFYGAYWYDSRTGYLPCPDDPTSCAHVPEWFPDLEKPLGAPLTERTRVAPYVWQREFEHASVILDLNVPNRSKVTFKSA